MRDQTGVELELSSLPSSCRRDAALPRALEQVVVALRTARIVAFDIEDVPPPDHRDARCPETHGRARDRKIHC